ncbi:MAG: hypothetical protein DWB93_05860 [Candidatus Poseidoniales archaeon]|nr:MAG: hypothetical protein DWB93_05860 [Candidatus Poseidoniales archaeon]
MAKSPEMLWLDVLDLEEKGDRENALLQARSVVEMDEKHADAWMAIARLNLPPLTRGKPLMPDLKQCSKAMAALKKVIQYDPDNDLAWELGGALLIDHLGMLEHGLEWWENRRINEPNQVTPLVEQIGILARMGYYEDCAVKLDELFSEGMDAPANQQLLRMQSVRQMVSKAAKMENSEIFNPRDKLDSRWEIMKRMKNKKPITENRFLFTFTAPIVFLLGILVMDALGDTALGTIAVFLIILFLFATITRLSNSLLNNLNRHALDLDRAIDFESTSGKICIPDEIRESKLYASMMGIKTPALKERMDMIINSGEKLPKKWELNIP